MANCLILGANGFIGSHLLDKLSDGGHKVRAFDRFSSNNINFESKKAEIFRGDFLNREDIDKALKDIDYVFHFISTTTPLTAENDPLIDIETNVRGSINLFEECVNNKIKKVIFASTGGAIYGTNNDGSPLSEQHMVAPISPYAIGKLSIERYLEYFNRKHSLNSVSYRISNPYGPRHPLHAKQGVINVFLEKIARNEPLVIFGDGKMVRDYIYIEDVANMISKSFSKTSKHVYNLGSGEGISINEIVAIIKKCLVDRKIKTAHKPKPVTFIDKVILDARLFYNEFHIYPDVKIEEGIKKTWEYTIDKVNHEQ